MDAGHHLKSDRFQRIQGAKLLIDSKFYPLYKGVNLIGRNKGATVNIKNLNVSQNQAIIILIDENQHFLSDFNSSNGTCLHNTVLTPFKLYDLTDNAEIKFGNVSAKFCKMNFDDNVTVHLQETMEMTQNMTQTFYGANTQLITTINESYNEHSYHNDTRTDNIHEMATQKMDYPDKIPLKVNDVSLPIFIKPKQPVSHRNVDIHSTPTQIISNKNKDEKNIESENVELVEEIVENCIIENVDINLHDAATQIVSFPEKLPENTSPSTSSSQATIINEDVQVALNELTSQERVSHKQTFHTSQEPSTSGLNNKTFDDSYTLEVANVSKQKVIDDSLRESIDNEDSNDSLDFLMQMQGKGELNSSKDDTVENIQNEDEEDVDKSKRDISKVAKLENNSEKPDLSDSDTDIDEPNIKSVDKHQENGDDSDTDIDESVVISARNDISKSSQNSGNITPDRKHSKILEESENDDSDTDVEETLKKSIPKLNTSSSSQETEIIGPKRKRAVRLLSDSLEIESNSKVQDNSDTELDEMIISSVAKVKEREILHSNSSEESDIVRPKRKYIPKLMDTQVEEHDDVEKTDKLKEKTESNNDKLIENSFNDSDIIASTQADILESKSTKEGNQSSEESFKLGITELMDDVNSQTQKEEKASDINEKERNKKSQEILKDDDDTEEAYLMATQKIDVVIKNLASTSKNELETNKDVDPQESQTSKKFTFKKTDAILDDSLTTILAPKVTEDEDVYMVATQKINDVFKQPKSKLKTPKESQDDFYMQATQCLNENTQPITNNTCLDENDVFIMPTQKIVTSETDSEIFKQPVRIHRKKNIEDDIYLQPTQPLNVDTEKTSTIILPCLEDDDDLMPTQKIEIVISSSNKIDDDDQCTQKLTFQDNISTDIDPDEVQTQCIPTESSDNETQKELQCLNPQISDVSVERPENPVAHILTEKNSEETEPIEIVPKHNFQIPDSPVSRRSKKTLQSKKVSEDRPETLSQIETFIKQSTNISAPKIVATETEDRPETLSQIDTFIKQSAITEKKINPSEQQFKIDNEAEDRPETLSQIARFINQPLDIKEKNKGDKVEKLEEKDQYNNEVVNKTPDKRLSKRKLSNQEDLTASFTKLQNIPEDNEEQHFQPSPKVRKVYNKESENEENAGQLNCSSSGKESKSDAEQSFVSLLESKNMKVRKTRTSNLGQIQVTVGGNRRSMGIAETSVLDLPNLSEVKTRKSSRRTGSNLKSKNDTDINSKENQNDKILTSTGSGSELSGFEIGDSTKTRKKGTAKDKKEPGTAITTVREMSEISESKLTSKRAIRKNSTSSESSEKTTAKRVSRRNSASSNSDTSKTSTRSTRKTRGIPEETSDTSEERTPQQKLTKTKNKEDTNKQQTKNEKVVSSTENNNSVKVTRGKKRTNIEQIDTPQKLSKSSKFSTCEDINSNSDQSKCSEPATPSRGKRISKVQATTSTSADFNTPKRQKSVSEETLLNSAERMKRKLKPKIVFTMFDSPQLESMIKRMGGSVVDSVDSSTVLVTEHIKRTQKLLTAVGQGKPICSPAWLQACKRENEFLDPWEHILLDKEAEQKWDFSLKESLKRAAKQKLLQNYLFQIMVPNAVDVLKGSIEACGGKCVTKSPTKNSGSNFVIIATPDQKTKYLKIVKQNSEVKVVEPEAIFDGVLRQELRLSKHLLT